MGIRHHAFLYTLRFTRPYGTTVWFFPVSQEFLLGYSQTVPTGLPFGFSRVPGVPPGLKSNRPYEVPEGRLESSPGRQSWDLAAVSGKSRRDV